MALIPNLSDIPELKAVKEGKYDCRILSAKPQTYQSGHNVINICIELVGEDNAKNFFHTLWLSHPDDTKTETLDRLRQVKRFLDDLGLDSDNDLEESDLVETEFSAELKLTPATDRYDEKNEIISII